MTCTGRKLSTEVSLPKLVDVVIVMRNVSIMITKEKGLR